MILFVASLTAWCFDRTLFHGAIGYCAIFTGFFGIALFVVLHFTRPSQEKDRADRPEGADGAGTADDGQTTNTAPPRAGDGARYRYGYAALSGRYFGRPDFFGRSTPVRHSAAAARHTPAAAR